MANEEIYDRIKALIQQKKNRLNRIDVSRTLALFDDLHWIYTYPILTTLLQHSEHEDLLTFQIIMQIPSNIILPNDITAQRYRIDCMHRLIFDAAILSAEDEEKQLIKYFFPNMHCYNENEALLVVSVNIALLAQICTVTEDNDFVTHLLQILISKENYKYENVFDQINKVINQEPRIDYILYNAVFSIEDFGKYMIKQHSQIVIKWLCVEPCFDEWLNHCDWLTLYRIATRLKDHDDILLPTRVFECLLTHEVDNDHYLADLLWNQYLESKNAVQFTKMFLESEILSNSSLMYVLLDDNMTLMNRILTNHIKYSMDVHTRTTVVKLMLENNKIMEYFVQYLQHEENTDLSSDLMKAVLNLNLENIARILLSKFICDEKFFHYPRWDEAGSYILFETEETVIKWFKTMIKTNFKIYGEKDWTPEFNSWSNNKFVVSVKSAYHAFDINLENFFRPNEFAVSDFYVKIDSNSDHRISISDTINLLKIAFNNQRIEQIIVEILAYMYSPINDMIRSYCLKGQNVTLFQLMLIKLVQQTYINK